MKEQNPSTQEIVDKILFLDGSISSVYYDEDNKYYFIEYRGQEDHCSILFKEYVSEYLTKGRCPGLLKFRQRDENDELIYWTLKTTAEVRSMLKYVQSSAKERGPSTLTIDELELKIGRKSMYLNTNRLKIPEIVNRIASEYGIPK